MDYATAVDTAPAGWRHFEIEDLERLPSSVRRHSLGSIPAEERSLIGAGDRGALERARRALFWTFVYQLEPERWDALAQVELIHPGVIARLPAGAATALDIGSGSGRLTAHLVKRYGRVAAVEPSLGLTDLLRRRVPSALPVAGWAEALPIKSAWSDVTAACGALGPEPDVLAELRRVTKPGGVIALISPEHPEVFEHMGWERFSFDPVPVPPHDPGLDEFFGPLDPPRELVLLQIPGPTRSASADRTVEEPR